MQSMNPLKILLIENDQTVARSVRATFDDAQSGSFELECVSLLSEGLERLRKKGVAAVLLELSLPDSHGIATFKQVFAAASGVPILILGGNVEEAVATDALGRGAKDYLLPDHLDSYSLPRAPHDAIERKSLEDALYLEKDRAMVTLNSIGDAVLCTDTSGNVTLR
jgi:DNA-binding NarL/FixJ family response regulator